MIWPELPALLPENVCPGCRRRQADVDVCPLGVVEDVEASNRNWMRVFSVKLKFLNSDMLKFDNPRTVNRVAVEVAEAAWAGTAKAAGLYHIGF